MRKIHYRHLKMTSLLFHKQNQVMWSYYFYFLLTLAYSWIILPSSTIFVQETPFIAKNIFSPVLAKLWRHILMTLTKYGHMVTLFRFQKMKNTLIYNQLFHSSWSRNTSFKTIKLYFFYFWSLWYHKIMTLAESCHMKPHIFFQLVQNMMTKVNVKFHHISTRIKDFMKGVCYDQLS